MDWTIAFELALLGAGTGFLAGLLGICGGMVGRVLNKQMDNRAVEKLFIALMAVIIAISIYNSWRYWVV